MSTPTSGSPQDSGSSGSSSGSQHSAPNFGGGWQQNQGAPQSQPSQGGSGSSQQIPSYGAPSSLQHGSSQQGQGSGAPQYRPAGGGSPQFTPAGGYQGGSQGSRPKGKGKPPLWVGIVSLVLGIVLGGIAIIVFFVTIFGAVSSIADTPSGSTRTLEAETEYYVFSDDVTSVDSCSIYSPEFNTLELDTEGVNQTAESGDETFTLLGTFTTEEAGEYRVSCSPFVSEDSMYISDAGIGGAVGGSLAAVGLGLLGGLLFVVGIVLIIVNRVTASKNRG